MTRITHDAAGVATGALFRRHGSTVDQSARADVACWPPMRSARPACCSPPPRREISARPRQWLGPGRPPADDAPVQPRGRFLRGTDAKLAGPLGPEPLFDGVRRDAARRGLRARRQVESWTQRWPARGRAVSVAGRTALGRGDAPPRRGMARTRSAFWGIICEDLPEPENRVELHPTATDARRRSGARLIYRNSENSLAMMQFNLAARRRVAAGSRRLSNAPGPPDARIRLAPAGNLPNGREPAGTPSSTRSAAATTSPIFSLSTAASSSPDRRSIRPPPSRRWHCAAPNTWWHTTRLCAAVKRSGELSAIERQRLAALAEIIVPRTATMPSAGDWDLR